MEFKMRKSLLLMPVIVSLVACASGPKEYKLNGYKGPEAMDNNEVVQAAKQCINNRMRPDINYLSVRTDQGKVLVPVSVNCLPL
jgi:hypothetical protein